MHPTVPFAAQHGAGPQLGRTPAQVRGTLSRFFRGLRAVQQALRLAIQIAEMVRLKPVGENPKQKMPWQLRRRPPAKDNVPAVPQLTDVEIAQLGDLDIHSFPVRPRQTDPNPRHEANVTGAWWDEAQLCRVGGKHYQQARYDKRDHRRPSPSEDRARASCAPHRRKSPGQSAAASRSLA